NPMLAKVRPAARQCPIGVPRDLHLKAAEAIAERRLQLSPKTNSHDIMTERTIRALVTGAGSAKGIGFAIAEALGRQGCKVVVTSTTARIGERAQELRKLGIDATGRAADLTNAGAAQSLVDAAGDIDVLVNNAGMASLGTLD